MRSIPKVWENVLIAIFAVQMLIFAVQMIFFWCAVQIFWCEEKIFWALSTNFCCKFAPLWHEFGHLMAHVLPPYVKFLKHSTKVCCIFLGVCVNASLWTACCCQKPTHPRREIDETSTGWLEENSLSEGNTVISELSERGIELELSFRHALHLLSISPTCLRAAFTHKML